MEHQQVGIQNYKIMYQLLLWKANIIDECVKHCLWYKNIFKELNMNIKYAEIKTDNKAAIQNYIKQTINPKSKHIDIKY